MTDDDTLLSCDTKSLITVATCNLNQWALDFDGNVSRIIESIKIAKDAGASYRLGPELEITGYGCEDHFLEQDTFFHSWQSLIQILPHTTNILCDIGMPVCFQNVRYNARVFLYNGQVILIRPKLCMADDGNYRETRWFTPWKDSSTLSEYILPTFVQKATNQTSCPIGNGIIKTKDGTAFGSETCEELFTPQSPHINLNLRGVEIIGNGSGSHHQLHKIKTRIDLITHATSKSGGLYLYANQQGCDGGRVYYDGCACIVLNSNVLAIGKQFSVVDVDVVTATVNLEDIRSYRAACSSRSDQAANTISSTSTNQIITMPHALVISKNNVVATTPVSNVKFHTTSEEIAYGPACWLWDYLRRTNGASGFFLPLSGGADSAATASIVGIMCHLVMEQVQVHNENVINDVKRITGNSSLPSSSTELASYILHTAYMASSKCSSSDTKTRAFDLANQIGASHLSCEIDSVVSAFVTVFNAATNFVPQFNKSRVEDLALQNIQARIRMVLSYVFAQLLPFVKYQSNGFLLVLGSANVDESLRGYYTKYDCSSADLNPIGGVSKTDLKQFLKFAGEKFYPSLLDIVSAPPTAELRPITIGTSDNGNSNQTDEADMKMTYEELSIFGRLRKVERCGPVWMFDKLSSLWSDLHPIEVIASKVKTFFYYYSANRHKMTTLTPSYHAESYSPDDNRFDLRPFLYNTKWSRQFNTIDKKLKQQ